MSNPFAASADVQPFTVVITSCNRFDLLQQSLRSLLKMIDGPLQEIIIAEDSGNEEIHAAVAGLDPRIRVLLNRPQLGQMKSIDRAYEQVKTDFAFHCEDDWEFLRTGFIAESFAILEVFPQVSMVGLRSRAELNPLIRKMPVETLGDIRFFHMDPSLHPEYFSYSFNPGLRRMSDYRRFAPVSRLGREEDVSYHFKKAGYWIANLEQPAVRHIGDERHVLDPFQFARPKTLLGRLERSARKRVKRLRRKLGGA